MVKGWISSYAVSALIITLPPQFLADNVSDRLRSSLQPRGPHDVTHVKSRLLARGNLLADRVLQLINLACSRNLPGLISAAPSCKLWDFHMAHLLLSKGAKDIKLDMCNFGAAYRGRVQLRAFNGLFSRLAGYPTCEDSICKHTGRRHLSLQSSTDMHMVHANLRRLPMVFQRCLRIAVANATSCASASMRWALIGTVCDKPVASKVFNGKPEHCLSMGKSSCMKVITGCASDVAASSVKSSHYSRAVAQLQCSSQRRSSSVVPQASHVENHSCVVENDSGSTTFSLKSL